MTEHIYDLAVSFAGEQRDYVVRTVEACKRRGLDVFYDRDKNNDWWGGNFIREQRAVYSSQTRYFVPFISAEYLTKPIPMDEFSAAMMTAVKQGDGYILPVLMDETQVPADLLHPHIHYLRAADYEPEQLALELQKKVQAAASGGLAPADLGPVVEQALRVRLPKIVPNDWSKYEELDRLFEYLTTNFRNGAQQLRPQGLITSVRGRDDTLSIRVERSGDTVAGLNVTKGRYMGDDHITWSVDWRQTTSTGYNGWATPKFDKERGRAVIDISDLALFGRKHDVDMSSASDEQLFSLLWDILIEQIER